MTSKVITQIVTPVLIRWVLTILGSSSLGVVLAQYLTPENVEFFTSQIVTGSAAMVTLIVVIQSILTKLKTAKKIEDNK